jgi:hypothetical protein
MRVRTCLVVAWVVLQIPAHAQGAPSVAPLELSYEAPEPCPPASALTSAVTRLVGSNETGSRSLKAKITVERDTRGEFTLALVTQLAGITGERVLHARSCDSVVDAAAVTLALILNPDIDTSSKPEPTNPSAPPATKQTPPTPATPPIAQAPLHNTEPKGDPVHLLGASAVGLHFGVMPNPGPDLTLGIGVGYGRWSMLALGSYALPQTVHVAGSTSAGAHLWHGTFTGLGCWSTSAVAPRVGACLGAAYTRVQGRGVNVTYIKDGSTAWVSPAASVFADFRLSARTALRFSGLVMHPLNRPDAHLDNLGTVQRPSTLTADLQAGVIVQVP